jgi:hypothetical protein
VCEFRRKGPRGKGHFKSNASTKLSYTITSHPITSAPSGISSKGSRREGGCVLYIGGTVTPLVFAD